MNASAKTEDYLKTIFELSYESAMDIVPLGKVAELLSLTPGTVTTMIKRIANDGLVEYHARVGCSLTKTGRRIALRTLRRHRVLETFLVKSLNMDWAIVHPEAELMEHGTSDNVIDRLWEFLGRPVSDPHGEPIPDCNLHIPPRDEDFRLSDMADNSTGILTYFPDRNTELLSELQKAGLVHGAEFTLFRNEITGTITATCAKGEISLSIEVAQNLRARLLK